MRFLERLYKKIRSRLSPDYVQRDLYGLLAKASPSLPIEDQVDWLDAVIDWIRLPIAVGDKKRSGAIQDIRIDFLLKLLNRHPEIKAKVSSTLQSILIKTNPQSLFCRTGLIQDQGFFYELIDRVFSKFLPKYMNPNELSDVFARVFQEDRDADWIDDLDAESTMGLFELFTSDIESNKIFATKINNAIASSLLILSARALAISISQALQDRMGLSELSRSPFFKLNFALMRDRQLIEQGQLSSEHSEYILSQIKQCAVYIDYVHEVLETSGVSVNIVYKLENLTHLLRRIRILVDLQLNADAETHSRLFLLSFISQLIRAKVESRGVWNLFSVNFDLLAMKTVERTGASGEHYITRTKSEYKEMLFSAGGGGFIAAFTSLFKAYILKINLPIFFEHAFIWANYSLSFIAMQLCHFTLATKTPSMTAASLANRLKELSVHQKYDEFLEEIAALSRSGFAAALGNIGVVVPTAIAIDLIFYFSFGRHLLSHEYGEKQLAINNPFGSLTIFYAVLTAGALWISSVAGGWIENWFVYNRLFDAVSSSKQLRRRYSMDGAKKIAHWLRLHISGLGTNIVLGFILAFLGIANEFLGFPMDVRHVTLTTGKIALGICGLTITEAHAVPIALAIFGIVVIGFINFSVSFALSLFVAARAQHMSLREFPGLLSVVWIHFKASPKKYFFPS